MKKLYNAIEISGMYGLTPSQVIKKAYKKNIKPVQKDKNFYLFNYAQIEDIINEPMKLPEIIYKETVFHIYESKMNLK